VKALTEDNPAKTKVPILSSTQQQQLESHGSGLATDAEKPTATA
jgi:hypothetical protein